MEGLNFVFLPFIVFLQFFLFSRAEIKYIIVFAAIALVCMLAVVLWENSGRSPLMIVSDELIQAQRLNTLIGLPALTVAIGYYAFATIDTAEQMAAAEKEKTENLLLNILPAAIAERFKNDQSYFAERFESATVLFADIVGFTALSEKISPEELAMFLNDVFSKYDALTEEQGLEKIKTIGDAYMVAGGIPTPSHDHARRICNLALRMQEISRNIRNPLGETIQIRIGICTGPVTAGVIGVKKFIYDLWGDTVNTASRMQSHAPDGGIQMTESVHKAVQALFHFDSCGQINVKGKGAMQTYLLVKPV
jgi:class 3 adenylate cyclase